jgi:hypothetical protein
MPYEPFHERFREIAEKETRTIIAVNDPDLPDGEYGLTEAYCNEAGCDCRRVFFNVVSWRTGEVLAVITYGWESEKFYAEWFGDTAEWLGEDTSSVLRELEGPALNSISFQSELALVLLEKVKFILRDKNYVNRIKRHYKIFKEAVDNESPEESEIPLHVSKRRVRRNDPCPCGSGKKYKKCCGK